jgi:hypothetical protein
MEMTRTVVPGDVTLVLPAYNERDNIAPLLSEPVRQDTHKHVRRVIDSRFLVWRA